ncbi:MAG: TonB-dependent receptor [Erythrobacter sp.]|nr:TonB-dependent receptor [Erythrobacter sp.]
MVGVASTALATGAAAQDADPDEAEDLGVIEYTGRTADVNPYATEGAPYRAERSADVRNTRPLDELPQNITVLTENQIDDSGYTDLARILDAQPGITVGTGENGNAFGDRYIIRGQEARSDVFVDGLRDPGMTTRESFVVEQIEISRGPSSTFGGRGTAGGAINMITKAASSDYSFFDGTVGVGSDRYVRLTGDYNFAVSDTFAIRANGLYAYTNIPDRDPSDRRRTGAAVSATWAPSEAFDITLDYYLLRAIDNPDLGDYLTGSVANGEERVPVETPAYAQDEDFQESDVDTFTGRINWQLADNVSLSNRTRYGTSDNGYVVTGARAGTTNADDPNGVYSTITFSTHQGWQDVDYFANQANLLVESEMLGGENDLIVGVEYTDHQVVNGIYTASDGGSINGAATGAFNCTTGSSTVLNNYCGIGPDGQPVANINNLLQRDFVRGTWDSDWHVETFSAYIMDTIDLTEDLTVFAGVRWDTFDYRLLTQNTGTLAVTEYAYSDDFWNGHVGVTYDLSDHAMIYASFSTAADINGGESDVGASAGYGGLQTIGGTFRGGAPERSVNWELGTKLDLFDERFLLTAAIFQTTKSDVFESQGTGYDTAGTGNTGRNRVRGFELGLAGNITDAWSLQGGLTVLDTEVLRSSDALNAAQLALGATNVGKALANTADFQFSVQSRYQLTDDFAFGVAVKHKSERYGGQPDTAAPFVQFADGTFEYSNTVPSYTVADLFAEYRFNNKLSLRVNVNNVFDETYYLTVYRSGTFLYRGDARQAVATLNLRF